MMKKPLLRSLVLGVALGWAAFQPLRAQSTTPAAGAAATNDSAYTALRAVGKEMGRETLDRVVEVSGRDGSPQPYLWKIVLLEPAGGTREVDVAAGRVTPQRPDERPAASRAVIHLSDLNLDSSGAFDATDAQARKVHLRFDSVNYVLRPGEATGKPEWSLNLLNQEGGDVGVMRLSASDGSIVSMDGRLAAAAPPAPTPAATPVVTPRPAAVASSREVERATPRPRVAERTTTTTTSRTHETSVTTSNRPVEPRATTTTTTVVNPPPSPSNVTTTTTVEQSPDDGGLFTRTGRTLDKTNQAVSNTLRHAGTKLQHFFTGRNDADQTPPQQGPVNERGD